MENKAKVTPKMFIAVNIIGIVVSVLSIIVTIVSKECGGNRLAQTIFEELGGKYERQGDYFIRRLTVPAEEERLIGHGDNDI